MHFDWIIIILLLDFPACKEWWLDLAQSSALSLHRWTQRSSFCRGNLCWLRHLLDRMLWLGDFLAVRCVPSQTLDQWFDPRWTKSMYREWEPEERCRWSCRGSREQHEAWEIWHLNNGRLCAAVYLVLKEVSMSITPIPLSMTKLASTYHLKRGSCSFKYSVYHLVLLKKRNTWLIWVLLFLTSVFFPSACLFFKENHRLKF